MSSDVVSCGEIQNPLAVTDTFIDGIGEVQATSWGGVRIPCYIRDGRSVRLKLSLTMGAEAFMLWLHAAGVRRMQLDAHASFRNLNG